MHPLSHRHINRLVCGEEIDGPHQGFHRLINGRAPTGGFRRALSVGCGSGGKEIGLLKSNVVQEFDLFEIGEFRRAQIQAKADEHGVGDRVTIHIGNAFEQAPSCEFDLVYWNNALHHMFDVEQAVSWSREALSADGCFAMDDFVGPSRFQWSEGELDLASRVRALLPGRFHAHPRNPAAKLERRPSRPSIEQMMQADPTEAADSGRILNAVMAAFSGAEIIPTGGVIYHLGLNDVLANFRDDSIEDMALLKSLLLLDETLTLTGHTHYAVALAQKATFGLAN